MMLRDLFFFGFLGMAGLLALRRPFIFVLLFIYIDILVPQELGYGLITRVPLSLIGFVAALASWLIFDTRNRGGFGVQQTLLLMLFGYCGLSTLVADFPLEAAQKWAWVWKVLVFAMFMPLALSNRLRIEAAATTVVLSGSALIIAGGIKTLLSGGGYGALNLMNNRNSGLFESSTISCFAIALIPLILFLTRKGRIMPTHGWARCYGWALCFACVLIPIGTEARTGFVCAAVLALCLLRFVRYRFVCVTLLAGFLALAPTLLPESFLARMATIETSRADSSASVRFAVWRWTWDYASRHPLGGGFDAYLGNDLRIELDRQANLSSTTPSARDAQSTVEKDKSRAYHSAYFEMLGEQGWPGLLIWLGIHLTGLWRMERLHRRYRKADNADQNWTSGFALVLQQMHLVYLTGAAFVGIAYLPFGFMIVALEAALTRLMTREETPPRRFNLQAVSGRDDEASVATSDQDARLAGWTATQSPHWRT